LLGRITHDVGWIALLWGGLVFLNIAKTLFAAMPLSQRNLFEVGVVCFRISIASAPRARDFAGKEMPSFEESCLGIATKNRQSKPRCRLRNYLRRRSLVVSPNRFRNSELSRLALALRSNPK